MKKELVLDVSNNAPISTAEFRSTGSVGLIAKATEGTGFQDKTLAAHRKVAKTAGVPFGSYLFLHARSVGDEAAYYLAYAKPKKGDIQPIIDAEGQGLDGATMSEMAARVDSCAAELEAKGYRPILYASSSFWQGLFSARPSLRRLRVWEAQYPLVTHRWYVGLLKLRARLLHGATVILWQFSETYAVGGRRFDASQLMVPISDLLIP